jgi:hypothetical protein
VENVRRFALVTSARAREVDPDLPIAVAAFAAQGCIADVVLWDDESVVWGGYDCAIVRSCWDYSWRLPEFLAWSRTVPILRNDASVIEWNVDKRYLSDLQDFGCPIVPTVWNPQEAAELPTGPEWVVKPTVSAGARDAARWSDPADVFRHVGELIESGRTAMVQPYISSVDEQGETALIFLGGTFSHAVTKAALLERGEGVRQDRQSRGGLSLTTATLDQIEMAQRVLRSAAQINAGAEPPLFARVDVVAAAEGQPLLLELELTEPSLFLPQASGAEHRLVQAALAGPDSWRM